MCKKFHDYINLSFQQTLGGLVNLVDQGHLENHLDLVNHQLQEYLELQVVLIINY